MEGELLLYAYVRHGLQEQWGRGELVVLFMIVEMPSLLLHKSLLFIPGNVSELELNHRLPRKP